MDPTSPLFVAVFMVAILLAGGWSLFLEKDSGQSATGSYPRLGRSSESTAGDASHRCIAARDVHSDGYIELRDRKKDVIISGGENISSIEVEQFITRHPAVLEVAVIAVPDEKWGEVPKAFVTLKPGHSATADEIISFCRQSMAHFKCPKQVEFGELPRTSTGKIQKYVLRDREWGDIDKRIH